MTRYYPNSELTFPQYVTVDGELTDAAEITFKWRIGRCGAEHTETPVRLSMGTYQVTITPTESGALFWRWDTDGTIDQAKEGHVMIECSAFDEHYRDYGG